MENNVSITGIFELPRIVHFLDVLYAKKEYFSLLFAG